MSAREDGPNLPPSSQSHFTKYENFIPDEDASFDHEFERLASSQGWVLGSQQYVQNRTIAMREELEFHYFPQSQLQDITGEKITAEEVLKGYQALCREVRLTPGDSIAVCKKTLKAVLVNIVDLIDARRTSKEVKLWPDFEEFRNYTRHHSINREEAKRNGGYLASLLRRLGGRRGRGKQGKRTGRSSSKALSGRVTKKMPS
ncbi:hypothetical protein QQS21_005408 [Conoideocrella luteorostrata]|uniref:Uncharacterized protein n=1 Tax=Conoideocrella luteorostrata TaxID=1105319 RepID=A0AAJ0CPQ2_9HYPO|nr:hypothetical protein QQS21_005408 [Conoideocrella luteorostrata]